MNSKKELEKNPVLANSFENQVIIGTRYSYTVNTQLRENPLQRFEERKYRTHNFYFNGNVDVAGNFIYFLQNDLEIPAKANPNL